MENFVLENQERFIKNGIDVFCVILKLKMSIYMMNTNLDVIPSLHSSLLKM